MGGVGARSRAKKREPPSLADSAFREGIRWTLECFESTFGQHILRCLLVRQVQYDSTQSGTADCSGTSSSGSQKENGVAKPLWSIDPNLNGPDVDQALHLLDD